MVVEGRRWPDSNAELWQAANTAPIAAMEFTIIKKIIDGVNMRLFQVAHERAGIACLLGCVNVLVDLPSFAPPPLPYERPATRFGGCAHEIFRTGPQVLLMIDDRTSGADRFIDAAAIVAEAEPVHHNTMAKSVIYG